jgi:asparagine N-glycosylation enzyme membrane subunit Stt3
MAERRPRWPLIVLGAAMLLGLLARMGTMDDVFLFSPPHAFSEDDHYHLRRILFGLRNAEMLEFDRFMSFPHGAYSWFTDGFDRLLMALVRLSAGAHARMPETVAAASLAIPFLSILALPLVYLLGARLASRPVGALAALVVAVLPAHAFAGLAGVVDHHCIETVLSLGPLLVLAASLEVRTPLRAAAVGALAGALAGATLYFWSGAPLLAVVAACAAGLATVGASTDAWRSRGPALVGYALATLPVTAHAVWQSPLGQKGEYLTFIVSRFHLVFAAILAALLLVWIAVGVWAARGVGDETRRWRRQLGAFAAVILLIGPSVAWLFGARPRHLAEVTAFVRSEGIVAWIEETAALWSSFSQAFAHFSPLLVILPPYAAWRTWCAFRSRDQRPSAALLELAGLAFGALTFLQFRHKVHWVPFAAVAMVRVLFDVHALVAQRRPSLARASALGLGLVALALFYQPLVYLRDVTLGRGGSADTLVACDFIREQTPPAAPPYAVDAQPTYSVLGSWDIGKTIAGVCERPSLGSADAYGEQLEGVLDLMRFFTTDDPAVGAKILDDHRVRYLLLPAQYLKHWEASVSMLGLARAQYLTADGMLTDGAMASLYERLYRFDGNAFAAGTRRLPALRELRLVYESRAPVAGDELPVSKVFERVAGVTLTAQLRPNEPTLLEADLRTNTGRRFTYRDFASADGSGQLRIRYPYVGAVRVRTPGALLTATIPASASGIEIPLR